MTTESSSSNPRDPVPLSTVWAIVPMLAGLVLGFSRAVEPYDYWWALAMGRLISTGVLPSENIFLYTMPPDAAFLNQPWLAQWLMFVVHDLGGPAFGIILLGVVCALFALVISRSLVRDGAELRSAVIVTMVALSIMAPIAAVRTRMYAILPAVLVASLLFGQRRGTVARGVFWVIPLTVLWSNVHGSFVVAVAWTWLLAGDAMWTRVVEKTNRDFKIPIALAIGTTIAGMLNPLGIRTYEYVIGLALRSTVATTVTEWQPPSWDEPTGALFLLSLTVTLFLAAKYRKSLSLFEVGAFALTIYLGASASRSLLFPAITMPFLIVPALMRETKETKTSVAEGRGHVAAIGVMVGLSLMCAPGVGWNGFASLRGVTRPADGTLTPRNTALIPNDGAVIFHDQAIGGQIEFVTGERSAFVDQRMELVPEAVWNEYEILSNAQPGWRALIEKYNISTFILTPDEQAFLCQALSADPKYRLVAVDQHHVMFRSLD